MNRTVYFLTLSLCLLNCSSRGFDRDKLKQSMANNVVISENEIQNRLNLKPQLKFPFTLGIYIRNKPWEEKFTGEDRDLLFSLKEELQKDGIITDLFFVLDVTIPDMQDEYKYNSLKNIRYAAAGYGADAVLILDSASQKDSFANPLSILYLTIIGLWIAPGSHREALFLAQAAMYDVRNEYLYLTVESESTSKLIRPWMYAEYSEPIRLARTQSLLELKSELKKRLKNLRKSSGN